MSSADDNAGEFNQLVCRAGGCVPDDKQLLETGGFIIATALPDSF